MRLNMSKIIAHLCSITNIYYNYVLYALKMAKIVIKKWGPITEPLIR